MLLGLRLLGFIIYWLALPYKFESVINPLPQAMGFIATILFIVSAAIMYLKLRHFQEELMEARQPQECNRRATISSIT